MSCEQPLFICNHIPNETLFESDFRQRMYLESLVNNHPHHNEIPFESVKDYIKNYLLIASNS